MKIYGKNIKITKMFFYSYITDLQDLFLANLVGKF